MGTAIRKKIVYATAPRSRGEIKKKYGKHSFYDNLNIRKKSNFYILWSKKDVRLLNDLCYIIRTILHFSRLFAFISIRCSSSFLLKILHFGGG